MRRDWNSWTSFLLRLPPINSCQFLPQNEKLPYVRLAIRKTDLLKILLMILWEIKAINNKKYLNLSSPLEEIGRMLGSWHGQTTKQNSPNKIGEKK